MPGILAERNVSGDILAGSLAPGAEACNWESGLTVHITNVRHRAIIGSC